MIFIELPIIPLIFLILLFFTLIIGIHTGFKYRVVDILFATFSVISMISMLVWAIVVHIYENIGII